MKFVMSCVLVAAVLVAVPVNAQQRDLADGMEAYWVAEYDRAVALLSGLDTDRLGRAEATMALKFLAASYLALGDEDHARGAFRDLIDIDPGFRLSETDFAPQILRVFESVRTQSSSQIYDEAKRAYQVRDCARAATLFEDCLEIDPGNVMAKEFLVLAVDCSKPTPTPIPVPTPTPTPVPDPLRLDSPTRYRVHRLIEGVEIYVDRDYIVVGAIEPGFLQGLECIQTANDDNTNRKLNVELDIMAPGYLFVIYDKRVPERQEWLDSFKRIKGGVETNNKNPALALIGNQDTFGIWAKKVQPGRVTLGPNVEVKGKHLKRSYMYSVCFRPDRE